MTLPTQVSRGETIESLRSKLNTLISHVDQIEEARLNDVSYLDDFQASSASDWDLFGSPLAVISGSSVGYTYEQAGTTSSGYMQVTLNGNQTAGSYNGSSYSKKGFNIGSNPGSGWEFHFRVGANWNSVADSPIARSFSLGIINTTAQPSAHEVMGSQGEAYYVSFGKTSNGNASDMAVTLGKGVGGNNWSVSNIAPFVTFTQANASHAPNPWYVISFRYTTNLLQAFVNGAFVSQVSNPFTFASQESLKIGESHSLTIGTPVSGSLMSFKTDYVHVLGRDVRAFNPLP